MRRSKELVVLLVTFAALAVFVLWYVGQRRAENRARGPGAPRDLGPVRADPAPSVDLAQHDGQTIDFSTGKPVVKDTPADQAALQQGLREIEAATKDVIFEAPKSAPKKP